jgi:hypothetical protein
VILGCGGEAKANDVKHVSSYRSLRNLETLLSRLMYKLNVKYPCYYCMELEHWTRVAVMLQTFVRDPTGSNQGQVFWAATPCSVVIR